MALRNGLVAVGMEGSGYRSIGLVDSIAEGVLCL
jgi:hypothetical protein